MNSSFLESQWGYLIKKKRGWLVSSVVNDSEKAGNSIYNLMQLLSFIVLSVVYVVTAFIIAPSFTIAMVVFAFFLSVVAKRLTSKGHNNGVTTAEGNSRLQAILNEHFDAMKLIKGSALYEMSVLAVNNVAGLLCNVERNVLTQNAKIKLFLEPLVVTILCVGIYMAVERMNVQIAELMVIMFVFMRLFPKIAQANQAYYQVLVYRPSFEKVIQATKDSRLCRERAFLGGENIDNKINSIEFVDVSFSYDGAKAALKKLNFHINKCQTVAIVGKSGSGKSTFVDLLLGLHDVTKGKIKINNETLHDLDLLDYRNMIGYVGQETVLVHDTIRNNITWGLADKLSNEKIKSISKLCHVNEFVSKLPDKYETIIGDKGALLSGGQRQRIAIARALARDPKLLILDEATSALDSESEKIVQDAIENLSHKITMFIIAHRLSTIVKADQIFVLDNGEIVEMGTFEQLIQLGGRFKLMYEMQNH